MAKSQGSGDLSPTVVVVVIAITILIVGLVGWWFLRPKHNAESDAPMAAEMQMQEPASVGAPPADAQLQGQPQ